MKSVKDQCESASIIDCWVHLNNIFDGQITDVVWDTIWKEIPSPRIKWAVYNQVDEER